MFDLVYFNSPEIILSPTFFLFVFFTPWGHFVQGNVRVWPPGDFCIFGEFGLGPSLAPLGARPSKLLGAAQGEPLGIETCGWHQNVGNF